MSAHSEKIARAKQQGLYKVADLLGKEVTHTISHLLEDAAMFNREIDVLCFVDTARQLQVNITNGDWLINNFGEDPRGRSKNFGGSTGRGARCPREFCAPSLRIFEKRILNLAKIILSAHVADIFRMAGHMLATQCIKSIGYQRLRGPGTPRQHPFPMRTDLLARCNFAGQDQCG